MMPRRFPAGWTCYCVTGGEAFLACGWERCWLVEVLGAAVACCGGTRFSCSAAPWPFFCTPVPCSRRRGLSTQRAVGCREGESIALCRIKRWYTVLTAGGSLGWYCYTAFMFFAWDLPGLLLVTVWSYRTRLSNWRVIGNMWNIRDFFNFYFFGFFFFLVVCLGPPPFTSTIEGVGYFLLCLCKKSFL